MSLRQNANRLELEATALVATGGRLRIAIDLHDATVSTHATIEINLEVAAPPWARWRLRRALQQRAAMCVAVLQRSIMRSTHVQLQAIDRPVSNDLVASLRDRYPKTVESFEKMNALDHLERVYRLEQGWQRIAAGAFDQSFYEKALNPAPSAQRPAPQYDLIYAGGGLGLLHAAVMAQKGWRVLLFDRGEVGCAHREWNISRKELAALVDLGLVTWHELEPIAMREYRTGLVRFHADSHTVAQNDLWLPGVLDVALDAGALLRLMRQKLLAAGGTVLDYRTFKRVILHPDASYQVEVEAQHESTSERYRARLLLDGMGSTSPLALIRHQGHPFAGVCPTVGTVAEGFMPGSDDPRHHDPTLGDILISVQDAQRGQQYMWEGFPGRGDELTIYLFYYDTVGTGQGARGNGNTKSSILRARQSPITNSQSPITNPHSLLALFEDYFTLLPSYKAPGPEFCHIKPVYGYIPARHSLRRQEAPLLHGVLPVGDSAAQQSPLTFCGFGSHVRNLARTTGLLDYALQHDLTAPNDLQSISAFQANVSLNWVFSRFMHPWGQPNDVNALQNIFLGVLNDLGGELATRFFQDRMRWSDYHKMVLGMFWRYPPIVGIAWRVLGPTGCRQWISDYIQFSREALLARLGRAWGRSGEHFAAWLLDRAAPRRALKLRARYAEWRAMGWI